MEEQCRTIDSQDIDASIDLVELNNLVVKMRSSVKKAKVQVIHKLCRTMKQLKNKKGTDDQVTKNKNKADRLFEEVTLIKDLPVDKISKYSLANTATFDEVCKNPKVSIETRAMTRLACCQAMQKDVVTFRKDHEDWESLAKFLIYKQTGRRYKKTRTKGAGSQAMKEMVAKQHGGSGHDGQEGNTGEENEEGSSDEEGDRNTDRKEDSAEVNEEGSSDEEGDRNTDRKEDSAEVNEEGSSDEEGDRNTDRKEDSAEVNEEGSSDEEGDRNTDRKEDSAEVNEEGSSDEEGDRNTDRKEDSAEVSEEGSSDEEGDRNTDRKEDSAEVREEGSSDKEGSSEIGKEITEQIKLVDEPSMASAKNKTGEKSADEQTTETTNVHNQRLKYLKIFTSKEDGEESSDGDDSSSENFANDEECSPKIFEEDEGRSESEVNSGSEAENIEGQTSDTDNSSLDAEMVSDSSASPGITRGKNLVPGIAKVESVVEDLKRTKLIGARNVKSAVDSKRSNESLLVKTQEKSKTEMKKTNVKKSVSPKKKGLLTSAITEKSKVEPDVVKPRNKPVNVKKGTMVIQKLNLDVDDAEDIAVSSGDDDSEEEDVPDFLSGSSAERKEKREARDMFFLTEDGEEEERNMSDGDDGNGDSSGVEEEDAEMTHHRGRQMIESVFIGALSKPELDRSDRNEGYRNFRGGRGRGGGDSYMYDRGEGQRGFHRDSYQDRGGRRGSFQDRGRRGSYHDRDGHRGSFQSQDGHRGSFQGHDRGRGGFRGHRGGDRGSSIGRGGGRFQQTERGSQGERYSKPYENRTNEHQTAEKVHPSWEASRKRKEQAASIKSFQGKKIKFDDSD